MDTIKIKRGTSSEFVGVVLEDGEMGYVTNTNKIWIGESGTNVCLNPDIPTNVSTFTNDAEYITIESVPSNTSELINDAHFIKVEDEKSIDGGTF